MALAAMLVAGTVSAYPSYFGQKMTVLAIEGNVGLGIRDRANAFNELTGAQVEVVLTGRDEQVVEQATELSTGTVLYDAYVSTASDMIAYQVQNLLPLNDLIEKDEEIRWSDIGSWFRTLGVYNNEILALPLDGDFHLMYYRQDVLAKAGLAPPKTLEEMVSVAKAINGTDMDGDGHGDVGFCIGFGEPSQGYMFVSLLLSLMQSKGTSQGYLFDPSTMEALQDNPAMADGLRMLAELVTVGSNKDLLRTFGWDVRSLFTSGKCGIIIDWGDIAGLSIGSYVNGLTGMARLPGSRKVWDREEQAYRACDTTLCPFGGEEGINSAIYAFGGWSYQINRKIKEERHQFVYDFGSYMCSPKISAEDAVDGTTGLEPYRYSHMLAGIWVAAGMAPASAENYVHAVSESLDMKNIDVARAVGYSAIRDNFHHAVLAVTEGTSPAEAATQLSAANNLVVQQNGGAEVLLPAYRKALGLEATVGMSSSGVPAWMLPTFSAIGGLAACVMLGLAYRYRTVSKQADKIYSDQAIAEQIAESVQDMRLEELDYLGDLTNPNKMQRIFINITETLKEYRSYIPKSVLNTLDQNHQMKGMDDCVMIALVNPPAAGRVAIVFTDIQSSTMTWEGAPFEMKTALELHNDVIRKAAGEYDGYEVKTIGDAFMLAFADLDNAAKFCLAVQVDLTEVDWPEGLLDLPQCAKVPHAFSGLRVRMGLHYGEVEKQDNAMTGRADYFGTVVNIAARLEAAGRGGGITVEKSVLDKLQPASLDASVLDLGEVELKGIKNKQTLSLLIPQALRERKMCLHKMVAGHISQHGLGEAKSGVSESSAVSSRHLKVPRNALPLRTALEHVNATSVYMRLSFSQALKHKSANESLFIVNEIVAPVVLACEQTSGVIAALSTTGIVLTWLGLRNASHVQNATKFIGMVHKPLYMSMADVGACTGSVLTGNVGTSQKFNMQIGECAVIAERLSLVAKEFGVFAVMGAAQSSPCVSSDPRMNYKNRPIVSAVEVEGQLVMAYQLRCDSLLDNWFNDSTGDEGEDWAWSPEYAQMFKNKDIEALRQHIDPSSTVMQKVLQHLESAVIAL